MTTHRSSELATALLVELDRAEAIDDLEVAVLARGLARHGAVVVRHGQLTTHAFEALALRLGLKSRDYHKEGKIVARDKLADHAIVYTATHEKRQPSLSLHQEMSYLPTPPETIWFYCDNPPVRGGETLLCDGEAMLGAMSPQTRALLTERPLRYFIRHEREHWVKLYGTENVDLVRAKAEAMGMELVSESDGSITTWVSLKSVRDSVLSKRAAFVNGLLAALEAERESRDYIGRSGARLADGSPIPDDTVRELAALGDRLSHPHAWQKGDIVILDNTRFMHGRRAVQDEGRRLFVILGDVPEVHRALAA